MNVKWYVALCGMTSHIMRKLVVVENGLRWIFMHEKCYVCLGGMASHLVWKINIARK